MGEERDRSEAGEREREREGGTEGGKERQREIDKGWSGRGVR